jgi:hypothetical protein
MTLHARKTRYGMHRYSQPCTTGRPGALFLSRDFYLHLDRAFLSVGHNKIVVVLDVFDGRVNEASTRQHTQGQSGCEEVQLAVSEAAVIGNPKVSWRGFLFFFFSSSS